MVEPGVADFVAQAAQLVLHGEQSHEDFFLAIEEEFILGLAGAGGVDDLIAVLTGLHNGIEIDGITEPGLLLQVEVVDGGKEIDNGHRAVAQPGSVIQNELRCGVQGNAGCFAGSQHDDGELGLILIPNFPKQITLRAVIVEDGLGAEGGFVGVHVQSSNSLMMAVGAMAWGR